MQMATDHAVLARFCWSAADTRSSEAYAIALLRGWPYCRAAHAQTVLARCCGPNSFRHNSEPAESDVRSGQSAHCSGEADHAEMASSVGPKCAEPFSQDEDRASRTGRTRNSIAA